MTHTNESPRHKQPDINTLQLIYGHGASVGFSMNVAVADAVLTGSHHTVRNTSHGHWLELYPALAVGVVERTHAAHCRCRLVGPARERVVWSSCSQWSHTSSRLLERACDINGLYLVEDQTQKQLRDVVVYMVVLWIERFKLSNYGLKWLG